MVVIAQRNETKKVNDQARAKPSPKRRWQRVKTRPRAVASALRRAEALRLRAAGCSYSEIGRALGFSKVAAFKLVRQGLSWCGPLPLSPEEREVERGVMLLQLEELFARLWVLLYSDRPQTAQRAVRSLLHCMRLMARLSGAERP